MPVSRGAAHVSSRKAISRQYRQQEIARQINVFSAQPHAASWQQADLANWPFPHPRRWNVAALQVAEEKTVTYATPSYGGTQIKERKKDPRVLRLVVLYILWPLQFQATNLETCAEGLGLRTANQWKHVYPQLTDLTFSFAITISIPICDIPFKTISIILIKGTNQK